MPTVECRYKNECYTGSVDINKCLKCANNKKRNYKADFFVEAKDEPIPEKHTEPKPYDGPAEQTIGYECPICHKHTNPYHLTSAKICSWCGYKLFLN